MRSTLRRRAVKSNTGRRDVARILRQHFEAIDAGQHHVKHDQQIFSGARLFMAALAIVHTSMTKPSARKVFPDQLAKLYIVVDNQDSFHVL